MEESVRPARMSLHVWRRDIRREGQYKFLILELFRLAYAR